MALRIAHLAFSSTGGAGSVASRLAEAQRREGHDAFVVSAISGSLRDAPLGKPLHTAAAVLDDKALRSTSFAAPISLLRDRLHTTLEVIHSADVIHLHWPNGFVDLGGLAKAVGDKKVVWTLHDMNAFTAVCHYSLECRGFETDCSKCPAVRPAFREAARRHRDKKKTAVLSLPSLKLAAPSRWLAQEAQLSDVFHGRRVAVIPNPLSSKMPRLLSRREAREALNIDADEVVFVVSASLVSDPLKAVGEAVQAFTTAFIEEEKSRLLLLGRGGPDFSHSKIHSMGFVDQQVNSLVLAAADYLVVSSLAENQPLVIAEAQAAGVSLLARNSSGLPEHLDIDPEGGLFSSTDDFVRLLRAKASQPRTERDREALSARAQAKFDPGDIAKKYLDFYA